MEKSARIYIAGHTGMVGSAIMRRLQELGYANLIGRTKEELDLTSQEAVAAWFAQERPEYVVLAAARVGGIWANNIQRAQFIYENLMIELNIIHQAYLHGVKKLLFLGSSCIYPKNAPQPLKEDYLLTGALEQTNEPYAIAKIAGIKLCESYFRQYGCNFVSVMPTNLYGPNDNYNLETSHVLPAIIRKMHLARCLETGDLAAIRRDLALRPVEGVTGYSSEEEIIRILEKYGIRYTAGNPAQVTLTLWGTGRVFREFLHVDDMASASVKVLEELDAAGLAAGFARRLPGAEETITFLNVGTGEDQTIAEIAELVRSVTGFSGELKWDSSKPDGTFKKLLDVSQLRSMHWSPGFTLEAGIRSVFGKYLSDQQD